MKLFYHLGERSETVTFGDTDQRNDLTEDIENFLPDTPAYQNLFTMYVLQGDTKLEAAIKVMEIYCKKEKK